MKALKVALATLVCVGCAKFPGTPGAPEFTRVTFTMSVAGKINTTLDEDPVTFYIYDVAIRATPDLNPEDRFAPQPVISSNNPNGRMAGSPTHFVEFDAQNPNGAEPFIFYRFATREEVPNPSDPDNPINLANFARSTRGRIVNFQDLDSNPRQLQFDLFINMLADTDEAARLLNTLQVNFLTMNRLATGVGGTRVIDSIGNNGIPSELNSYIMVDLRQDGIIGNNIPGQWQNIEPEGDTVDPDLDIINWSIEVRRQG